MCILVVNINAMKRKLFKTNIFVLTATLVLVLTLGFGKKRTDFVLSKTLKDDQTILMKKNYTQVKSIPFYSVAVMETQQAPAPRAAVATGTEIPPDENLASLD